MPKLPGVDLSLFILVLAAVAMAFACEVVVGLFTKVLSKSSDRSADLDDPQPLRR